MAVPTVTIGSAAMGRATAVAASPATSGAAGRRTAATKRSRRRTKFRAPTNPPPSATAPINKASMSSFPPPGRAPYATCGAGVSAANLRTHNRPGDSPIRGVMMPRMARAGAVALGLLAGAARLSAQTLRVPYTTFTLPNGLQVLLHEDHSVPVVAVNTWYHVGSSDERAGRTGFAHLFEHIMFMGSAHVPTGEFDRLLEAAGADNNGSTTEDRTNYYEDGPANALPLMLYLDSDRLGFLLPEITADKVDIQRGVVQNERRQSYENRPYGLAQENILDRLYPPNHPYHWPVIGSMQDLQAATLEDVRRFFQTYYTPNNATVAIAGDISPRDARALVERYFGDIARGPAVTRTPPPAVHLTAGVAAVLEDRVQLPRVYDAWHTVKAFADDDAVLDVVANVLAGGRSSRLYRRLVYELQIATDVAAFQDGSRIDGKFEIFATARPGHELAELQRVIDEELEKLAAEGPTAREVERARNTFEAQFLSRMERVGGFGGKADQLNFYNYFVGSPDYFQKDLDRYGRVTAAGVQRAAKIYLTGAHRVVLSVVPQGKPELGVKP
ncbi:MAG: insulinase family protein [Gemmatimonadetes bacterium]|nr:MAG: insulinase family protein [Gemmatimonadota bacterium]